jgi:hypothetical protein
MGFGPFTYNFGSSLAMHCRGRVLLDVRSNSTPKSNLFGCCFAISFFFLAGDKPWRFYERFCRAHKLFRFAPYVD